MKLTSSLLLNNQMFTPWISAKINGTTSMTHKLIFTAWSSPAWDNKFSCFASALTVDVFWLSRPACYSLVPIIGGGTGRMGLGRPTNWAKSKQCRSWSLSLYVVLFNLSAGEEPSADVFIAKGTLCDDPNVCPIYLFIYLFIHLFICN